MKYTIKLETDDIKLIGWSLEVAKRVLAGQGHNMPDEQAVNTIASLQSVIENLEDQLPPS